MALKRLRQRFGLASPMPIHGFPVDLFGATDWFDLRHIVNFVARTLSDGDVDLQALTWALALDDYQAWRLAQRNVTSGLEIAAPNSVIERRKEYQSLSGLSMRTIERREDAQAVVLANYIHRLAVQADANSMLLSAYRSLSRVYWVAGRSGHTVPTAKLVEIREIFLDLQERINGSAEARNPDDFKLPLSTAASVSEEHGVRRIHAAHRVVVQQQDTDASIFSEGPGLGSDGLSGEHA